MITKTCSVCGESKPIDTDYYWTRGRIASGKCKGCTKAKSSAYQAAKRAARPEKPVPARDRDLTEKRCNACDAIKPVSEFYWNVRKWSQPCKACWLERERQKRRNDPEGVRTKDRRRKSTPEYKDGARVRGRAYHAANREQAQKRSKAWYAAHVEESSAASRAWRQANPKRTLELAIRRRARVTNAPIIEPIDRAAIIDRDNAQCYLCGGYPTGWNLTLDHVIPLTKGGGHCATNLRVACRSCNSKKRTRLLTELSKEITGLPHS